MGEPFEFGFAASSSTDNDTLPGERIRLSTRPYDVYNNVQLGLALNKDLLLYLPGGSGKLICVKVVVDGQ